MATMTAERARILAAITEICDRLKGPGLSNVERLMLHEDRKDLRAELARIEGSDAR